MPANAIHVFCIALAPLKKSNRTFGTRGCAKPRTAVALCATATRSAQCGAAASQRGLRSMSRRRRSRPALAAASIDGVMRPADVAIPPAITSRTPPAAECDPRDQAFRPRTLYELSRLTRFVNMFGFPAVAPPVGFDDRGLPVALQVVERPGMDRELLLLAAAVQARSDWHDRVPDALASSLASHGVVE